jgi:hypothetical protein
MTAATAPPWPGSRVLLGWWRELAPRQPRRLAFARLLLHRVEALVVVPGSQPLDPWQRALLRLIHARAPGGDLEQSLSDLILEQQVLARMLHELTADDLVNRNGTGVWRLTSAGRHALETGARATAEEERRIFFFVEHSPRQRPPHFVALRSHAAATPPLAPEPAACSFDVACLEACIRQTPQWKAQHGFPADVQALLLPRGDAPPEENWRRVILDALESLALVFIQTLSVEGRPRVLGFPVRAEGWALEVEPALTLGPGWEDVLPDLAEEPPPEAWRQAWQAWCQPRSLPPADVDACRLERVDHRLLVHAPSRLIERLRAARSDAIKQEAWLLAGTGRTRLASQLELLPL